MRKKLVIVVDLFDVNKVYLDEEEVAFNPLEKFTVEEFPYEENVEYYLLMLSSDALYFQAHPWGIDKLNKSHYGRPLKTVSKKYIIKTIFPTSDFISTIPRITAIKSATIFSSN